MIIATVHRVEQHQIKRSSQVWKIIDQLSFKSKNLYNYANYIIRQGFINNGSYKDYYEMAAELKTHAPFKAFGSQVSQQTLRVLDKNWKSFFAGAKGWSEQPHKYLGKPKLPKYKKKDGRFHVILSNIQFRVEDGYIRFSWKPLRVFNGLFRTRVSGKVAQIRFIPRGGSYVMEVVYESETLDCMNDSQRIAGIDIGVDNFATIANNIGVPPIIINGRGIKSMNQFYNKKLAEMKSDLEKRHGMQWGKRLQAFTDKHRNKMDHTLHQASKLIIDWCVSHDIGTIVIGRNVEWKQHSYLSARANQHFVQVPHARFIEQVQYKAENQGIKVVLTEESYTSGTSFLDDEPPVKANYDKSRRIERGLFKSNTGVLINADLNAAYQIIKKVFPNAFANRIEGVGLHPIRVNL